MKYILSSLFSLIVLFLQAQDTIITIKLEPVTKADETEPPPPPPPAPVGRFEIGAGVQVNSINSMGTSAGPLFSLKANAPYGKIAGVLNISYNLNNGYTYRMPKTFYAEDKYFVSDVRYNFLKIGLAMQIPIINRSNMRGFCLSALVGLSYYNGLGSGEYKSGFDKPGAPDSVELYYTEVIYSQSFTMKNHNLQGIGIDLGLSASYTVKQFQFFAEGYFTNPYFFGETIHRGYKQGFFGKYTTSKLPVSINIGVRYCLYTPWQVKPPKRKISE